MKKLSSLLVFIFCLIPFLSDAWILRDEFNTALSAGSVHNTTSEPSGHTRTVTDTENKLSIADGKLTFSGGKASAAYGDPGVWFPAITRAAGLGFIFQVISASGTFEVGADTNTEGELAASGVKIAGTNIQIYDGTAGPVSGTITAGQSYNIATLLRGTGQFILVKGGTEYPSWTLHYISATNNTATVYPGISNYNGVITSSFIRIPSTLYLPSPLCSDSFATTFSTSDGAGHAESTGLGSGGSGKVWSNGGTTWSVSGAKAINSPTITGDGHANVVVNGTFTTDANWAKGTGWTIDTADSNVAEASSATSELSQTNGTTGTWYLATFDLVTRTAGSVSLFGGATPYVSTPATYTHASRATSTKVPFFYGSSFSGTIDNVVIVPLTLSELISVVETSTRDVIATVAIAATPNGTQAGLAIGIDSATDPKYGVIAYHDGTNCKLDKLVNGVWTNVISAAATWANDAELRVIKDGTTYRLYYNNALVGTATISDASIINNTRHGLFSTDVRSTLDNFTLYARGTGNEYNILNQLMSTTSGGSLNLLGVGK